MSLILQDTAAIPVVTQVQEVPLKVERAHIIRRAVGGIFPQPVAGSDGAAATVCIGEYPDAKIVSGAGRAREGRDEARDEWHSQHGRICWVAHQIPSGGLIVPPERARSKGNLVEATPSAVKGDKINVISASGAELIDTGSVGIPGATGKEDGLGIGRVNSIRGGPTIGGNEAAGVIGRAAADAEGKPIVRVHTEGVGAGGRDDDRGFPQSDDIVIGHSCGMAGIGEIVIEVATIARLVWICVVHDRRGGVKDIVGARVRIGRREGGKGIHRGPDEVVIKVPAEFRPRAEFPQTPCGGGAGRSR